MPAELLGRTTCPECGNAAAHVKRSAKGNVFRFCPVDDCRAQYIPRGQAAIDRLIGQTRPEKHAPASAPASATATEAPAAVTVAAPEPAAAPAPTPAPAPRRRLFG